MTVRVIAATSDAQGTVLPRSGVFPGVYALGYSITVIEGELAGTASGNETRSHNWPELAGHETMQTPSASMFVDKILAVFRSPSFSPVVRRSAVAYAFLSGRDEPTESPWRELRRTLEPLRVASDALIEDTHDVLQAGQGATALERHAGLAAVARLADVLGLSRPVILRMGGVPPSTFYAWQKNPQSIIRTPTITRLLRLQAQVAILSEALGTDRMRAWIFTADHLGKLQGGDTEFSQALDEARAAVAAAIPTRPRRRMRRSDYAAISTEMTQESAAVMPAFPGATKVPDDKELDHKSG